MTKEQIFDEIRNNKLCYIIISDWNENKLAVVNERTPDRAVTVLNDRLDNFTGYKRLLVNGRKESNSKLQDSFSYELNMKPETKEDDKISGSRFMGIGATEYINMHSKMLTDQFDLQKQLLELKMKQEQNDPTKWLPVIQYAVGIFKGGNVPTTIQGPAIHKGKVSNVPEQTLSEKEIGEKILATQIELAKKIKGSDYLKIIEGLNANPEIQNKIDKIILLIDGIAAKPDLIDMAIKFV